MEEYPCVSPRGGFFFNITLFQRMSKKTAYIIMSLFMMGASLSSFGQIVRKSQQSTDEVQVRVPLKSKRAFSVKTNIVPWVATIANMELGAEIYKNISVSLPVMWCPWVISKQHSVKIFGIQPEARWWFDGIGQRHYAGVHATMALFNLRNGSYRYQDSGRPLLGGGIDYGYVLPINKQFSAEFSIGLGYASLRYDRYYNVENGVRIDKRQTNYWGIDKLGILFVYHFKL